jgi:hypothetical protein
MTLPPMPEPAHKQVEDYSGIAVNKVVVTPLFTADQMRSYAEQAVAAERERCARVAEPQGEPVAMLPLTCRNSDRSDCALFGTQQHKPLNKMHACDDPLCAVCAHGITGEPT